MALEIHPGPIHPELKQFADVLSDGYAILSLAPAQKKKILLFGSRALHYYGQLRATDDIDVRCELSDLDGGQEYDLLTYIAKKIDTSGQVLPRTFHPGGFWFEMSNNTLDWFIADLDKTNLDAFKSRVIYENRHAEVLLPQLEALILQKLEAYRPGKEKHALDIFEVAPNNTLDAALLLRKLAEYKLTRKWNNTLSTFPTLAENSGLFPVINNTFMRAH